MATPARTTVRTTRDRPGANTARTPASPPSTRRTPPKRTPPTWGGLAFAEIRPRLVWPYPDLVTLTPHPRGQWCKRYTWGEGGPASALRYFGPWARPDGSGIKECAASALAEWRRRDPFIRNQQEHQLERAPLPARLTLRHLAAAYLIRSKARVGQASGISPSMYRCEKHAMSAMLRAVDGSIPAATFGPREGEAILETIGHQSPSTVRHVVSGIRRMFKWAHEDHALPAPMLGTAFRPPSLREFRLARRARRDAVPIYEPAEIRVMLAAAGPTLRAAILMAINGGYGSSDLSAVPSSALQRRPGDTSAEGTRARLEHPRQKTATIRAAVLWPETVAALQAAQPKRAPIGAKGRAAPLLPSRTGGPLVRQSSIGSRPDPGTRAHRDRADRGLPESSTGCRTDLVARQFKRMLQTTALRDDAGGRGPGHFYLLRHTFATMAELMGDSDTRRLIMGHTPSHALDDVYVAKHGWHRIESTCERLREWLYGVDPADVRGPWSGALPPIPDAWKHQPGRRRLDPATDPIDGPAAPADDGAESVTKPRGGVAPLTDTEAKKWRQRLGLVPSTLAQDQSPAPRATRGRSR